MLKGPRFELGKFPELHGEGGRSRKATGDEIKLIKMMDMSHQSKNLLKSQMFNDEKFKKSYL